MARRETATNIHAGIWLRAATVQAAGDCVHFNSHIDVVEVGSGWTQDPFGGALVDGKIYGRGACDMKGGLAASIIAAEAFVHTNPDFQGCDRDICDRRRGIWRLRWRRISWRKRATSTLKARPACYYT